MKWLCLIVLINLGACSSAGPFLSDPQKVSAVQIEDVDKQVQEIMISH